MPATSSRGKYGSKVLKDKVDILREVDAGRISKSDIAKKYGIPKSTLSTYIRNRKSIEDSYESKDFTHERKRLRHAKHPEMENALISWIKEMRSQDVPLSGPIITAKAADFALRLNIEDFTASDGWFHRFRERHELVFRRVCGERGNVSAETCMLWKNEQLQDYLRRYSPDDIFNADETALFFKLLPDRTITYKGDSCTGGKRSKERITVMVAANMAGTEKLPLFVIGKSLKPRCFKNIRTLPTEYAANGKAWMTADLFKRWLTTWDRKLELRNRKVLLIVDNCSAHKMDVELKAIELAFLPANTTAILQPMDQGVIKNMKSFYRRHMLERMILCGPSYTVTLLGALHMVARAWDQVTPRTIANCFRHSGFIGQRSSTAQDTCVQELTDDIWDQENVPTDMHEALQGVRFSDYVDADTAAVVCGVRSDEDILAEVSGREEPEEETEEEQEVEETTVRPSPSQVLDALSVAHRFFSHEEGQEETLHHLRALEHKLMVLRFRGHKQQAITDFFHQ